MKIINTVRENFLKHYHLSRQKHVTQRKSGTFLCKKCFFIRMPRCHVWRAYKTAWQLEWIALFGEVIAAERNRHCSRTTANKSEFATQYSFLIPWKLITLGLVCLHHLCSVPCERGIHTRKSRSPVCINIRCIVEKCNSFYLPSLVTSGIFWFLKLLFF